MKNIKIGNKIIGQSNETFIVAEMSANHNGNFDKAVEIIKSAKKSGADAIKIQTYTADTITLDCDNEYFQIKQGTIWDGTTLHKLYQEAFTPWEWQKDLKKIAEEEGLIFFSSPFDKTAVDFLEKMDVDCYKIASFEITDIPFIKYIASIGKPVIMATGIATLRDIDDAVNACKSVGNDQIILLKCTSAYPSPFEEVNLKTMANMKDTFGTLVGLSDHTMGTAVSIGAVALGATMVEKHFTLSRSDIGPDSSFSMEPTEFSEMAASIRILEKAIGKVTYDLTDKQKRSREHSRSLFITKDMQQGDLFSHENIRSVRPAYGLETKYIDDIIGKRCNRSLRKGTPMAMQYVKFTD